MDKAYENRMIRLIEAARHDQAQDQMLAKQKPPTATTQEEAITTQEAKQ